MTRPSVAYTSDDLPMSDEKWIPIPGMGGRYDVSDHGHVRSWINWRNKPVPRLMYVGSKGTKRHQMVILSPPNTTGRRQFLVHRLVLLAFVGPCPDGMEVRHIDGEPTNNQLGNLAYGTHSENELDKVRHGTHNFAGKTHCPHGHPYSDENTRRDQRGYRWCKTCRRDAWKRRRAAA